MTTYPDSFFPVLNIMDPAPTRVCYILLYNVNNYDITELKIGKCGTSCIGTMITFPEMSLLSDMRKKVKTFPSHIFIGQDYECNRR